MAGHWHASLWTGSPGSWVDLNPAHATESSVYGVFHGMQVGKATIGGRSRASWWNGAVESWTDLHQFADQEFLTSQARGVSANALEIWVVGRGLKTESGRTEALLWVHPNTCPADLNADHVVNFDDLAIVLANFGTFGGAAYLQGDLDGDANVDLLDLSVLLARFGSLCD